MNAEPTPTGTDARTRLAEDLVLVLPSFARWVSSIRNADTPFGRVAHRQVEILYLIRKRLLGSDRVLASQLATHMDVQRSVVTRILASLEASGFITRQVDEHDARAHWIEITDTGRAASEYIEDIVVREMLAGIDCLEDAQIREFTDGLATLRRLSDNLEAARRARAAHPHDGVFRSLDTEAI
ncbi:MAG: MarR family transcriptional regulator [Thermomicrobiales bacterium]